MEDNATNYTTNKTIMEFYKANIDFHIEYLLFLNSLGDISKESFLTLAPILVSIKQELYNSFAYDFIPDYAKQINMQVEKKLSEILERENHSEIKEHIGLNINEKDICNFSAAIMLKRFFSSLGTIENNSDEGLIANSILRQIKCLDLASNIKIEGIKPSMMDFFTRSLGVKYSELDCIERYLYEVLSLSEVLISLLNKINQVKVEHIDPRFLIEELNHDLIIKSTYSLSKIMDDIEAGITAINQPSKGEKLSLEKQD